MQTPLRSALVVPSFVLGAALLPSMAQAQTEGGAKLELIRPSSRPMFATFSLAPALNVSNAVSQLKIGQAFGYHFSGDGTGFAVGGELQESFGSGIFVFQAGPKVWYDFALSEDLGIYLSPTAMVGFTYASSSFASDAGFDMQFGFEGKMVLNDRALIFFRPFSLDIAVGSDVAVRYDLVFGAGATF